MKTPSGELTIQVVAMPANTNPDGDIFGGWLLSQMDLAAGVIAQRRAKGRVVTIAVDAMVFKKPVFVGELLCCYAKLIKTGTTSMTIKVEAWKKNQLDGSTLQVTEGTFTFVAINEDRRPRPIDT